MGKGPHEQGPVFRFAPSPNGPLHLGHALSAGVGFAMARRCGGRFLVRIEDIDTDRSRKEHVDGIFRDLTWLGIEWERPVLFQSQRFAAYRTAAERLRAEGLLYPCFVSRAELAWASKASANGQRDPSARDQLDLAGDAQPLGPRDPDGGFLYCGALRVSHEEVEARISRGERPAWRIDMARACRLAHERLEGAPLTFREFGPDGSLKVVPAEPEAWGDAVIVRKDTPASYMLAVVLDDAAQGVTHVTRGSDLFASTSLQRLLQVLLGLPEPKYHHHRLILDPAGAKLSKSRGAESLAAARASGITPDDIWQRLGLPNPAG